MEAFFFLHLFLCVRCQQKPENLQFEPMIQSHRGGGIRGLGSPLYICDFTLNLKICLSFFQFALHLSAIMCTDNILYENEFHGNQKKQKQKQKQKKTPC